MGHRESRIAQQDSYWTAIGAAAGESPRRAPYQHQCAETFLRHRRCVGALAAAAMPLAQDSFAASAAALSPGPGTAALRHAAGKSRAHCQHSVLADGRAGTCRIGRGPGCMHPRSEPPSPATARFTSCWKMACRPCARWRGFWFAKANPVSYNARAEVDANVAELVDAPDLGSGGATRASSSLAFRTTAYLR